MTDGGFRPAFNGQFATATATQVIVGVEVSNVGSDLGQAAPRVEQIRARHGKGPDELLVDGGFVAHDDIVQTGSLRPAKPTDRAKPVSARKTSVKLCAPCVSVAPSG